MNELVAKEKEIEQALVVANSKVMTIKVIDEITYKQAADTWLLISVMEKKIKCDFLNAKKAADEAHKAVCALEKSYLDRLKPLKDYLNKQQVTWQNEQEAIRKAEENRLRAEALKKEEEDRIATAIQAEAEGEKKEVVEEILETPVFVPPPIVEKSVPKISGQTMTTIWRWRLKDINLVPRQFLVVNEVALNAHVKNLKERSEVPGIEVYPEQAMRGVRQ